MSPRPRRARCPPGSGVVAVDDGADLEPVDDPVTAAGWLPCGWCSEPAYAHTATWLGPRTVLATYVPDCAHAESRMLVVDLDSIEVDPRCRATTRAGRRCCNRARGDGWCANHDPAGGPGTVRPDRGREGGGRDG